MTGRLTIAINRLPHAKDLACPDYQTAGAAGMDLAAALPAPLVIAPGARALVPTGFRIAVPDGYEAQIRPRSGLALRHGVTVLNAPGTIDADYRGEILVLLVNHGPEPFTVQHGERIAQMIIAPCLKATLLEAPDLDETVRGEGGYGSTGATGATGATGGGGKAEAPG